KRYQRGRELLDNLENCKESRPQAAAKPATAPKGIVVPDKVKAAVQSKFVGAPVPKAATPHQTSPAASVRPAQPKAAAAKPVERKIAAPAVESAPNAAAAAAGWSGATATPQFDTSNDFTASRSGATIDGSESQSAYLSVAAPAPEVETLAPDAPKIAVDPMMAERGPSG